MSSTTTTTTPAAAPAAAPAATLAAPPDPRPRLRRALDQLDRLVGAVGHGDLARSTPCAEFDVRGLLAHVVAVGHRAAHVARGGHPSDVPHQVEAVADGAWGDAWAAARADADAAWADAAVLARQVRMPWGPVPGAAAAAAFAQELTVHAGDLAVALGRERELDEDLAAEVLAGAERFLPAEPRGGRVPFGPVVPVAATEPASVRLAAWTGRDPAAGRAGTTLLGG